MLTKGPWSPRLHPISNSKAQEDQRSQESRISAIYRPWCLRYHLIEVSAYWRSKIPNGNVSKCLFHSLSESRAYEHVSFSQASYVQVSVYLALRCSFAKSFRNYGAIIRMFSNESKLGLVAHNSLKLLPACFLGIQLHLLHISNDVG